MSSETPLRQPHGRSSSRPRSRPTTPLRRSSRGSITNLKLTDETFPLNALEPSFAELSDSLAMLDSNFQELSLMHQSISRFSESFAAFLYGLNMNAFCVDFPEAPDGPESFRRNREREERRATSGGRGGEGEGGHDMDGRGGHGLGGGGGGGGAGAGGGGFDAGEMTFMTNDTSFVNEPPPPTVAKTPGRRGGARGGAARGAARGGSTRGSGIARGRGGSGMSYR